MRDPYSVLGVTRSADQDTIRKAYKKLARQYHPDLNKDASAADKFKEINAAYDMIGDDEKRKLFNDFGEAAFKPGFDADRAREWQRAAGGFGGFGPGPGAGGMGGFGGFGPGMGMGGGGRRRGQNVRVDFGDFGFGGAGGGAGPGGMDMEDLLNMFGGGGAGAGRSGGMRRGADVESLLQISLKDALEGTTASVQVVSPRGGRESLRVHVPPGIHDGGTIRLRGKGRPSPVPGGEQGDMLIKIEIQEHPLLKREGDDLLLEVPLTVREALAGDRIEVPTLEGNIRVKVPAGVTSGQRLRLRGKGMPLQSGGRGDLYLVLPRPRSASA